MTTRLTASTRMVARHFSLGLAILAFGGFGIYLLKQSHAATVTQGQVPVVLSLAPANARLRQGDVINIAVNVDAGVNPAGDVDATITYPSTSLRLDAVRGACPAPVYKESLKATSMPGSVVLGCTHIAEQTGQTTVATLVFTALADAGDAALHIDTGSVVRNAVTGNAIGGATADAKLALASRTSTAPVVERVKHQYTKSRDLCPKQPGKRYRCFAKQILQDDGSAISNAAAQDEGYGPVEWHNAYQLPCTPGGPVAAVCATPETFGPATIVITDAGMYSTGVAGLESDMAKIDQKFGIPPCNTANGCLQVVNQQGKSTPLPPPNVDSSGENWDGEIIMDVAAVHEICQTCKIVFMAADNSETLDAANDYAAAQHPIAVSNSWGTIDNQDWSDYDHFYNHPGVAQVIANGDDGTFPQGQSGYPSSLPNVLSVAGTTLTVNTDGSRSKETVWNGSGGGCAVSAAGKAQSWQTALPNWVTAGCGAGRAEGDISADADPNTGITVYTGGIWDYYGGTSLAAPLIAGMFGLVGHAVTNDKVAPSVLYDNFNTTNFFDVTFGSDCTTKVKTHCTAGAGYDTPSGLGTPIGTGAFTSTESPAAVVGDINRDGKVNITDLSLLLKGWSANYSAADINTSGKVDITDLSSLLSGWTG